MKGRIRWICMVCLLWLPLCMMAQSRLTGKVTDSEGKTLPRAMVKAYKKGGNVPLAYTRTDDDGAYVLMVAEDAGAELQIKCSMLGYHTTMLSIANRSQRCDVVLKVNPKGLRQVTVKAPTIRAHGDTLVYNVANLKSEGDRVIEDVIARIPGVKVDGQGGISYMGESINNFYIEGLDMLKGRYALATRNIRPDDVANVEVFENHQPIRALENIEHSSKAALNLKLKKSSRNRWIGQVMLGAGWGDNALWNGELFTMSVGNKWQHLMTLKTNNTGHDYVGENRMQYEMQADHMQAMGENYIPETPFGGGGIAKERYLENKTVLATVNNITKLKGGRTVSVNADYMLDKNAYNMEAHTSYYIDGTAQVVATDNNRTRTDRHRANVYLNWERNDSINYFTNNLWLRGEWRRNNFSLYEQQIDQRMNSDAWGIADQMQWVRRRGKRVFQLNGLLTLNQMPAGSIRVFPTGEKGRNNFIQRLEGTSFTSSHYTQLGWLLGKRGQGGHFKLSLQLATEYHRMQLGYNELTAPDADAVPEEVAGTADLIKPAPYARADGFKIRTTAGPNYSVKLGPMLVEIVLPIDMYNLRFENHRTGNVSRVNRPYFRPKLSLMVGRFNRCMLTVNGGYASTLGSLAELLNEPVYLSYRQLSTIGSGTLSVNKQVYANGFLRLNKPLSGFSMLLTGGYTRQETGSVYSMEVAPDGQLTTQIQAGKTISTHWQGMLSMGKNFYAQRMNVRLNTLVNVVRQPLIRQQNSIYMVNRMIKVSLMADKQFYKDIVFASARVSWGRFLGKMTGSLSSTSKMDDYSAEMKLNIQPIRHLLFYVRGEFKANGKPGSRFENQFYLDGGAKYKIRSVELELTARNLTNRKAYFHRSYSESDLYTTIHHLRPIEFLLSCKWMF